MNRRTAPPLSALGIDELEQRTYEALIGNGEATSGELSKALQLPRDKVRRALNALEEMGLVSHSLGRPQRYLPISPDIGLEALVLQRQEALHRARAEVAALQKRVRGSREGNQRHHVELITNPEAERRAVEQMQRAARHEISFLVRPPLRTSILGTSRERDLYQESQARGVRFRCILDDDFLALPTAVGSVRDALEKAQARDDIRVVPRLSFKMVLADRHSALIPLSLEQSGSPALLVRSSALLDALHTLFEMLWEQAAPIAITRKGELHTLESEVELHGDAEILVQLLAAGLNDKAIAHELGISKSTLDRRVAQLRQHLEARTRFQAGWVAALRLRD